MSAIIETAVDFIKWCNDNSGFTSFIFSLFTIILSVVAVVVAVYAAHLPYKQRLKIYTAIFENRKGIPVLDVYILNVGNCSCYLDSIVLEQDIMHPLALGYLDEELSMDERILVPGVPHTYKVTMQNYNAKKYDHENYPIKVTVETTNKKYCVKIGWTRG